ncbi:MAG: prepilin-type N-terminal cleavage/methylation domain-containing protein [Candidatus Melainabacteria bacterium]|nr:prepilin-type N-terminal cleavage/methylation domain-containing protein [Candidatus Melainabacteria bacterium]
MMLKAAAKGFTLIELAIVIAIVAILAAVAIPRFTDMGSSAQQAVAQDFTSQLVSGAAMYTARMSRTPDGFTDFVTNQNANLSNNPNGNQFFTISTQRLGDGSCTIAANSINCTNAFDKLTAATYTWANGAITPTITQ